MSDFYQRMFTMDGGKTYTVFGAAGEGTNANGITLATCVGLVSDVSQRIDLKFAGMGDAWITGVTLNAGVIYPYRPIGVKPTSPLRGLM